MRSKILGTLFLLLLPLSLSSVFFSLTPLTVNISSVVHVSQLLAPGMAPVPITFQIINLGSPLFDVNITPISSYPLSPYNYYNSTENITIPELSTGASINATFLYKISPSASDGVYKVYVEVSGKLPNGTIISKNVSSVLPILGYVSLSAQSLWGSLSSPLVVSGGETNLPLTIVLINTGNVIVSNATVILRSEYPVKFQSSSISVGYLPIGQPVEVTTYASIYPNVSEGVYVVPIIVEYFNGVKQTVNMTIPVNGYTNFSVSTVWGSLSSPITVSAGETQVPLTFIVRNLGDVNALNVSLSFNSEYPISFTQKSGYIGIVPAGGYNYVTVNVNVYPNATPGIYYIPVTLHYFQTKETTYAEIVIYSPNITLNAFTIPPQLFPGYYDVEVKAIIINYGSSLANNVTVSLSSPFPIVSQNQFTLGALPQGAPSNISFLINIPNTTSPGYYYINFTVKYDGGKYTKPIKIEVYPKANLQIVGVYYSTLNSGASNVPITITIKNVGNATAKNVKAILGSNNVIYPYVSSSNPLMALTASEVFLGDIPPGQEVNITYDIEVSSGASSGNYTLPITLIWNQTGGLFPFVQNDKFSIQVSPSPFSSLVTQGITVEINGKGYTISWLAVIVFVIIIVLIVLIAGLRSRRRK